jgi:hypothetical protein
MAVVKVFNGDSAGANAALSRLRNVVANGSTYNPVFEAILAAALVQVSAMVVKDSKSGTELLSHKNSKKPGAKQVIEKLIRKASGHHPGIVTTFESWNTKIDHVLSDQASPKSLSALGAEVGY